MNLPTSSPQSSSPAKTSKPSSTPMDLGALMSEGIALRVKYLSASVGVDPVFWNTFPEIEHLDITFSIPSPSASSSPSTSTSRRLVDARIFRPKTPQSSPTYQIFDLSGRTVEAPSDRT